MLKKFNDLFNKIIFEQIQADNTSNNYVQAINSCDAFFREYIEPQANKYVVIPYKARYNTFRVTGYIDNIIQFFKNFKVNKYFMNDASKFEFLNPMFSLNENAHLYNKNSILGTEGQTLNSQIEGQVPTNDQIQNAKNKYEFGRWYNLTNYEEVKTDQTSDEQTKNLTPLKIANKLAKLVIDKNNDVTVEITVNCDHLPNNSFEELAKAVPMYNVNNDKTLSDTINSRPDVVNPIPNKRSSWNNRYIKNSRNY